MAVTARGDKPKPKEKRKDKPKPKRKKERNRREINQNQKEIIAISFDEKCSQAAGVVQIAHSAFKYASKMEYAVTPSQALFRGINSTIRVN